MKTEMQLRTYLKCALTKRNTARAQQGAAHLQQTAPGDLASLERSLVRRSARVLRLMQELLKVQMRPVSA